MMGLISRRPWFRPRCVVMASAATSPARMPTLTLFSAVQKGCWWGAWGRGELPLAVKLCACMATLSKRIERRDFICSPVISCLSKMTINHRHTGVHGPILWGGWPVGKSNYIVMEDYLRLVSATDGAFGTANATPDMGFSVAVSNYYVSSYEPADLLAPCRSTLAGGEPGVPAARLDPSTSLQAGSRDASSLHRYDLPRGRDTRLALHAEVGQALPGPGRTRASALHDPSFYKMFTSCLHPQVSLCKNRWNPTGRLGSAPTHPEKICGNRLTIRFRSSKIPGVIRPRFPRRNNMIVPAVRSLLLAALLALPVAAANDATRNSPSNDAPKNHNEWTVAQLQAEMASGKLTSENLTREYITRIVALDQNGPGVNAVIELNPDALEMARNADKLRKRGIVLGPLHGIPVLVKDNVDTGDLLQTTAGSFPLRGKTALQDSTVAANLRAGGPVMPGKTNLSEWANFRSFETVTGWSGRGGPKHNLYR